MFNFEETEPAASRETSAEKAETASTQVQDKPTKVAVKKKKSEPEIFTVTHLNRTIKFTLSELFPQKIVVEGELSNFKRHGSGHLYFSLKDENSTISAAMWRSSVSKLKFEPDNGMAVIATARLEVYEPQGKYQLIVEKLEPAGIGALELAFRQMAEKLHKEGLFAAEHKKQLPSYPMTIGIVTSGTGAAVRDINQTLGRRWPFARKLLYPVAVQGPDAAGEIAAAIEDINKRNDDLKIDILIVGRGGGSLEDLWPFNEEVVARSIFASKIPIISGVGHEIDTTIADLVADVRAATPTAAAELAVPVAEEELLDLHEYARTITFDIKTTIKQSFEAVEGLIGRPFFRNPMSLLDGPRQSLDETQTRMAHAATNNLGKCRKKLDRFESILKQIEPHSRISKLKMEFENTSFTLQQTVKRILSNNTNILNDAYIRLERKTPANDIKMNMQAIDHYSSKLKNSIFRNISNYTKELEQLRKLLISLDHRNVLKRGYSLTRDDKGRILNSSKSLSSGQIIKTELADGDIESKII